MLLLCISHYLNHARSLLWSFRKKRKTNNKFLVFQLELNSKVLFFTYGPAVRLAVSACLYFDIRIRASSLSLSGYRRRRKHSLKSPKHPVSRSRLLNWLAD
ncbi:hypothetical protein AAHA92_19321 [Salvia divinorum]|uniref:Uncharacterized protein n=1 Tax=Salvia divinorum TaxID=28513 RepID=A0ABD1H4X9_SALDI